MVDGSSGSHFIDDCGIQARRWRRHHNYEYLLPLVQYACRKTNG
ncbi:hypothetical protein HMPREF1980_01688 [Actinomyces sp. oral taxon 172 str. F0311]|nr:hypothetical protein HMPREF1980_01688 [Actinomyces sp. oral taxon 172 str. F0311]